MNTNELPVGQGVRGASALVLPSNIPAVRFKNIFTGKTVEAAERYRKMELALDQIFGNFPIALLKTS